MPCPTSHAKRSTSARVLPVPAPAMIASGPPGCVTASVWASVSGGPVATEIRISGGGGALNADGPAYAGPLALRGCCSCDRLLGHLDQEIPGEVAAGDLSGRV